MRGFDFDEDPYVVARLQFLYTLIYLSSIIRCIPASSIRDLFSLPNGGHVFHP